MKLLPVLVVVAFTVVTSASRASAECAWVLWEDTMWPPNKSSTDPVRAYNTKQECDDGLSAALATFTPSPGRNVQKDMTRQAVYVTVEKSTTAYRYVCLPDTVDPRAPKR
jgi:hypothetical protein